MRLYEPQIAGLEFEPKLLSYPAARRPGFEPGCQQWAEDFKSKPYVAVKVSVETHIEGFLCVCLFRHLRECVRRDLNPRRLDFLVLQNDDYKVLITSSKQKSLANKIPFVCPLFVGTNLIL